MPAKTWTESSCAGVWVTTRGNGQGNDVRAIGRGSGLPDIERGSP